jgi:hypothetical protein
MKDGKMKIQIDNVPIEDIDEEESTVNEDAINAWERIQYSGKTLFEDWLLIGVSLQRARSRFMFETNSKKGTGRRFNDKMSKWLEQMGFDKIHKTARSFLMKVMDDPKVVEWYRKLSEADKLKTNHPITVMGKYRTWLRKEGKADGQVQKKQTQKEANAELQKENDSLHEHIQKKDEELREANEIWEEERKEWEDKHDENEVLRERLVTGIMAIAEKFIPESRYEEFKEQVEKFVEEIMPVPEDEDEETYEPMFN